MYIYIYIYIYNITKLNPKLVYQNMIYKYILYVSIQEKKYFNKIAYDMIVESCYIYIFFYRFDLSTIFFVMKKKKYYSIKNAPVR